MSRPRVTKMSGAGNDFVVVGPAAAAAIGGDAVQWTRRVCRRGLSVGADGVLFVEPGEGGAVRVRFLNPDGSAAFCGNGSRCAARFAALHGLAGSSMLLDTAAGPVRAEVDGERVRLHLAGPRLVEALELDVSGESVAAERIDAGTPHLVIVVDDASRAPLERWGPELRRAAAFGPDGVNVDVLSGVGGDWRLRTWERGVEGETLACGSGAVAAALTARRAGAPERIEITPTGGVPLAVELLGSVEAPREAILEGDARVIFEAELHPEATCGF